MENNVVRFGSSAYISGGTGTLTAGSASNTQTGGSGWTEVQVPGTSSSSGTLTISATNAGSSGNAYWDDVSIDGGVGAAGGQE